MAASRLRLRAKKLEALSKVQPQLKVIVLEGHGLFTWSDTAKSCYEITLMIIKRAEDWFAANSRQPAFGGGSKFTPLATPERAALAACLMSLLRGKVSKDEYKLGHFEDSTTVLDFVCSTDLLALAALGTSCSDHFLRTKIRPFVIDFDPMNQDFDRLVAGLDDALSVYRADYITYYTS